MDNLLTEDVDVRGGGYALTRVYVTNPTPPAPSAPCSTGVRAGRTGVRC
jgi:hypothetical protein